MIKLAKIEIADSIYFHADDINSEIFNYALEIYQEKLKKKQQIKEKNNRDLDDDGKPRPPFFSIASITDPNRMPILNILLVIIAIFILFYLGIGSHFFEERNIIPWMKSFPKGGPKF